MVDDDASLMPADPGSWQAVNTMVSHKRRQIVFNAYFGMLRPLDKGNLIQVFKRWGNPNLPACSKASPPLADHSHTVLYPTVESIQARDSLQGLQGTTGVWFAGGWNCWFDSHEAAYRSTLPIVQQLRPIIDPGGKSKLTHPAAVNAKTARPESVRAWLQTILRSLPVRSQLAFVQAFAAVGIAPR